jgi:hypothetical protein
MSATRSLPALTLAALCACAARPMLHSDATRDAELVPADEIVELGLDVNGRIAEIEYHTTADHLPDNIRAAMESTVPGGKILSCEKEIHGKHTYWEVEKRVGGLDREVMFDVRGKVIVTEFQIPLSEAPAAVLAGADTWIRGGEITSVEEVRKGGGLSYHVKKEHEGMRYKLVFTPGGELIMAYREVPAEIEVPVR